MDWTQTITIIGSVLVPMLVGFGRIMSKIYDLQNQINRLESRLSRFEGYIEGRESVLKIKGD